MISSISIFSHIIYFLYFIITFLHREYTCMLKTSFILSSLHSNQKTTIDKSTLPRGERPICLTGVYLHFNFNPRSREGSDARKQTCCKSMSQFQSTLPRGERRHGKHLRYVCSNNFNPRSREGSDGVLFI